MIFSKYVYSRPTANQPPSGVIDGSPVILPVPNQLGVGYRGNWASTDMGMVQHYASEAIGQSAVWMDSGWQNMGQSIANFFGNLNLQSAGSLLGSGWEVSKNIGSALAVDAITTLDLQGGGDGIIDRGLGFVAGWARNPFMAMLYQGPSFRQFAFQWKLVASNRDEAKTIRSIIRQFKLGLSPDFVGGLAQNHLYRYPNVYWIKFIHSNFMFKFGQCVCTSVDVDYHSEGVPAYFRDAEAQVIPFSITLRVEFQEIEILTKQSMASETEDNF